MNDVDSKYKQVGSILAWRWGQIHFVRELFLNHKEIKGSDKPVTPNF